MDKDLCDKIYLTMSFKLCHNSEQINYTVRYTKYKESILLDKLRIANPLNLNQ